MEDNPNNCLKMSVDNIERLKEIEDKIESIINNEEVEIEAVFNSEDNGIVINDVYETESEIIPIGTTLQNWIEKCKSKALNNDNDENDLKLQEIHEYQERIKQHQKELRKNKDPEVRRYIEMSWIYDYYLNNRDKSVSKLSPSKYKKMHHYTNEVYNSHKPKVDESKKDELFNRMKNLKITKMPKDRIKEIHDKNHNAVSNYTVIASKSLNKKLPNIIERSSAVVVSKEKTKLPKLKNSIEWVRYGLI
jgi:hypothetical protein